MKYCAKHERREAHALVSSILEAGYGVRIHDGEEFTTDFAYTDKNQLPRIIEDMGSTDMDFVYLYKPAGEAGGKQVWSKLGYALLVYGNDPGELVADYTESVEGVTPQLSSGPEPEQTVTIELTAHDIATLDGMLEFGANDRIAHLEDEAEQEGLTPEEIKQAYQDEARITALLQKMKAAVGCKGRA